MINNLNAVLKSTSEVITSDTAVMNSMVLTSGEVTGLSQDRVSKQDAVDG